MLPLGVIACCVVVTRFDKLCMSVHLATLSAAQCPSHATSGVLIIQRVGHYVREKGGHFCRGKAKFWKCVICLGCCCQLSIWASH